MNQRREFLKKSILGASAVALIPGSIHAEKANSLPSSELPVRNLGKTGIKVPVLSMGTGDTNNPKLVKAVLDSGVKLLGTSAYYGNGNNEAMLGELLKTLPRDSYLIATSVMPKGTDHQNGIFTDSTAGISFKTDIEAGLKRLKVDHVDILFLPFVAKRESVFFEPLLRAMEDLKKEGKTRFIGIATHSWIDEAIKGAADTKIYDVVMAAYNFKLERLKEVNEAVDYAAAAGIGMIAMKTMAGGYWDKERTQPINSGAALKWVLSNKNIHTMMSGMTTFDELQNNLAILNDPTLKEQDLKDLKLAGKNAEGMFCLQCHDCDGKCPKNIDIPTVMRSYMYAYGYRNLNHAQQTLEFANLPAGACENCTECLVNCRAGFSIKNKIMDIARLKDVPSDFIRV